MWGSGFLLGIGLSVLFWLLVILPGDIKHREKRLSIIREKLDKIKKRKLQESNKEAEEIAESESNENT